MKNGVEILKKKIQTPAICQKKTPPGSLFYISLVNLNTISQVVPEKS